MDPIQSDSNIFARSITIVQYPFVRADTCIHGAKVIMNFVHAGKIHVPAGVILDPFVKIIIVRTNPAYDSSLSLLARKQIKARLREATEGRSIRMILPRAFIPTLLGLTGLQSSPAFSKERFEYIDTNIQDAMQIV